MKRTAVVLGLVAAMGVSASAAWGSAKPIPVKKPASSKAADRSLQTKNEGGRVQYRLGDKGLWME
jgi:hypothetical protein